MFEAAMGIGLTSRLAVGSLRERLVLDWGHG